MVVATSFPIAQEIRQQLHSTVQYDEGFHILFILSILQSCKMRRDLSHIQLHAHLCQFSSTENTHIGRRVFNHCNLPFTSALIELLAVKAKPCFNVIDSNANTSKEIYNKKATMQRCAQHARARTASRKFMSWSTNLNVQSRA